MIGNHESIDVFIGLDVGKGEHHPVAVDRTGMKLFDKALPNGGFLPYRLSAAIDLTSMGGSVLGGLGVGGGCSLNFGNFAKL